MKYLRSEIAKFESYKEQRDFELSLKNPFKSFSIFQESFLHSSNERHIQHLELIEKYQNSFWGRIIGINAVINFSELIGTASFSDNISIDNQDKFEPGICSSCTNYHGWVYGGVRLICAIYPYGCDQNYCPDYTSDV